MREEREREEGEGGLGMMLFNHALLYSRLQHRFVVFHIEFSAGCLRRYDAQGQEIEANFGLSALVRTGYLHSSYSETGTEE